jgi:AhpD family alkylhydroperoxidase
VIERIEDADRPAEDRRVALRSALVRDRGYWSPSLDDLLRFDPGFFECAARVIGHPWRRGVLDAKTKELILLAIDAAVTNRNGAGACEHVRQALACGATPQQVLEVLQLVSTIGIHACTTAVPILIDELNEAGQAIDNTELSGERLQLKAEFVEKRGYWNEFWDGVLRLDPQFFAAYSALSAHPWETGTLEPKVRELIYTAFDASATHLYEPGLRQHIRNALASGATGAELMEVLELASGIGVDGFALAASALDDTET